ncbi:ABC transporter substrate-binding protein [Allobranchiibius sp. CTAmp26]|uniref:ABC transporter substrate-binding protein n=1 Tax=Allobranchiibius sp. CTAmp26 TaxID=2815214 RepID=UPI001AA169CF|nr:ABC transporter substrate-binding protein [Allobranchiibius sp. CTAmp26]MBO1753968.1 ABC transporter substrate-binding protein [Allobranchiibius sp. CTAmp26]
MAAVAAAMVLGTAGCTKSSSSGNSSSAGSSSSGSSSSSSGGGQQQVQTAAGGSGPACTSTKYGAPKLDLTKVTVGFSQSESTSNPFRATETKSITDEAKRLGIKLIQRNANANVSQQNTDIQDMISQGAKVLIVAPENSDGLTPALTAAKAKHIPVLTIDRTVKGTACSDFIGFIGSNFYKQAQISADDLAGGMGGKGEVAVLQGTSGNNVATDRTNGFTSQIKAKYPNIKVVASQTANFDQATGQKVMEQILQSHPKLTGVYAENDTMALGAIQAIRAAGKTPGKDIKVVAIDGTQQCVQDVANGVMVADVETNPRFGPLAFSSLQKFYGSTGTSTKVIIADHHFTKDNAKAALSNGDVY